MVSDAIIKELQQIVREDYGREISLGEAAAIMNDMVGYFDLLAEIHYREKVYEKTQEPNHEQQSPTSNL
jgi:hypothetical protein